MVKSLSVKSYLQDLSEKVQEVKQTNKVSTTDWERYLSDIAITLKESEPNSSFTIKALVGYGGYTALKSVFTLGKIGSQLTPKLIGKGTAKAGGTIIAAKTGASVAGKIGAELLDPIVGIGIIIWDVWDYNHTVQVERSILQKALFDYLKEMKLSILDNPVNGMMTPIDAIESKILDKIETLHKVGY